jgi:hypothetical protein
MAASCSPTSRRLGRLLAAVSRASLAVDRVDALLEKFGEELFFRGEVPVEGAARVTGLLDAAGRVFVERSFQGLH